MTRRSTDRRAPSPILRHRGTLLSVLAGLLLVGCSSSAAPGIVVDGKVTLGPFCPVERPGSPCPVPPGAFDRAEAWARDGDAEVRANVLPDGSFALQLAAGKWQVSADAGMSCTTVTVTRSQQVAIECDTGIR